MLFRSDVPDPAARGSWGSLFGKLGVDRIPQVVVVDRQGKIVATGSLNEVFEAASKLASEAP